MRLFSLGKRFVKTPFKTSLGIAVMVLLWGSACTDKKGEATDGDITLKSDSVALWIARGKDAEVASETRYNLLQKALAKVKKYKSDSAKTRSLSQISLAYLRLNDSLQFRATNREVLALAEKTGDSTTQAETHWDLAEFFRDKAKPDSAYAHFSKAQRLYSALGEAALSGTLLFNMAIVQSDIKDYTGSEITTIRAIEILKPLEEYVQLYKCYNNLGLITIELKEYNRALDYFNTAMGYLDKMGNPPDLVQVTQNNIGTMYQEQGDHQKAISYFAEVLAHNELHESEPLLYARALSNKAYSLFRRNGTGDTTLTRVFLTALRLQDSIADIQGIARTHHNMAEYCLAKKDTAMALVHAQKARAYAIESNNNKRLLQTLRLFPHLDPKNMYTYVQEYIALSDSLQQEERRIRDKFARISYETDEVLTNNRLLAKQRQLWIWIATVSLLLSIAFLVILNQRRRNLKLKFQRRQQENNEEIFELMLAQKGKLEEGRQMEQQRVSEELHDNILSQMLGIRLVLTGLNNKTDGESIERRAELIKKLQQLEEEIRTISHELNNASSQKLRNFILSIEDLLRTVSQSSGLHCDFGYDPAPDWDQLKGDVKINVYRIVQEALQNCVKYAKAENISLNFIAQRAMLHVTIVDDGIGFDVSRGKRGIGMKNISSRIKKMGGTWHIDSKIGEGTAIHLEIPIENFVIPSEKRNPMRTLQSI